MVQYKCESISSMLQEAKPLIEDHFKDVMAGIENICDPNYEQYIKLEELGIIKAYSARKDGNLIGYAVFLLQSSLSSKNVRQALQVFLFVHKSHRGIGYFFIKHCDRDLQSQGINIVQHQIPVKYDCGKLFGLMGYQHVQSVYSKRLN